MAQPALQTRTNAAGATAHYYDVDGRKVDVADEDIARIEGINNDMLKLTFLRGYQHPENAEQESEAVSQTDTHDEGATDKDQQQGSS